MPGLEALQLRAGLASANNVVRWPYVAENHDLEPWLSGGELIFVTGITWQWQLDDYYQLIEIAEKKAASGIVVLTGSALIHVIPEPVLARADKLAVPLLEQPFSLPMVRVTELISNAIIQADMALHSLRWLLLQLINSSTPPAQLTLMRAEEMGVQVSQSMTVAVVNPISIDAAQLHRWQYSLNKFLALSDAAIPLLEFHQGWLLVVENEHKSDHEQSEMWSELLRQLESQGLACHIGVSQCHSLEELNIAAKQARQAVEFIHYQNSARVIHYADLGINQLFAEVEDREKLRQFCQRTLGPLFACCSKELLLLKNTLLVYFEQLGSARKTALVLNIHRNTLTKRLKKIEALTACSLQNSQARLCLHNALVMEALALSSLDNRGQDENN